MGFFSNLFGKKEANHNGLLNKIANPNPDPNGGLFDRVTGGGGLLGGLFNRNKPTPPPPSTQDTNFPDNNRNGGSSW